MSKETVVFKKDNTHQWKLAKFYMLVNRGTMVLASRMLYETQEEADHAISNIGLDAKSVPVLVSGQACFTSAMQIVGFEPCE